MANTLSVQQGSDRAGLLRIALQLNATTGVVAGLLSLVGSEWLAAQLGVGDPLVIGFIGLALIAFAATLIFISLRVSLERNLGWTLVVVDTAWVILSLILALTNVLPLTDAGRWIVVGQALIIAIIAELEFFGTRRLN